MTDDERVSLQNRVDQLGLTKDWKTVVAWAEQSKKGDALEGILATLEKAMWAQITDCAERDSVVRIAGQARNTVRNTPAQPGAVAVAKALREALIIAIDRTGVDLMYWPATKGPPRWDGQLFAEMNKRAFWRYDDRLARAGPHLLAARRILAEPPVDHPDYVKDALAKRQQGRPRQWFQRAAVERTLIEQLTAIAPPGGRRAKAKNLAITLLKNIHP